ncbi:MAG: glycosyltransferase [Cyclobacteriaceae bacterium]
MKVLMFGWEFPPHISGGLGTACAGLTQALEKEEVDVLFTVPKLHGGEFAHRTSFLSASAVPIRQKKIISANIISAEEKSRSSHQSTIEESGKQADVNFFSRSKGTHTVIEVPSLLSPYAPTSETDTASGLQNWNYSFDKRHNRTLPANLRSLPESHPSQGAKKARYVKEPYPFSGAYNSNLLEEVERYAQAGAEIARRHSFDVIHAHDWMTYRAGIAAKKISGKPLVVHVHATEIDRSGANINPAVFAIEKEGMSLADKVVTVSYWTKKICIQHFGVDEKKIEVVHNGISPRSAAGTTARAPFLGSQIVTFLGRITHQKGPMYFVEAARKVHEQFPDAHFVVAGSGDQLPHMLERIAQARLSRNFHFTGFLKGEDIDRIWAMSNVYVMPSVSEPFGIAPLEAIQAGVPVILSKQAGVSEVMPHAMKVDFWNSEALAEAICNLLRFKSLANTLKKNGSEQIKNITWDKAAKKITTLYYELSTKNEKPEKSDLLLSGSPTQKASHTAVL